MKNPFSPKPKQKTEAVEAGDKIILWSHIYHVTTMKIISPNNHPVIKQIKACDYIPEEMKLLAIKDITKMITNDKYRLKVTMNLIQGNHDINVFMKIDSITTLFRWFDSDLFNKKQNDFWMIINECIQGYPHQNQFLK